MLKIKEKTNENDSGTEGKNNPKFIPQGTEKKQQKFILQRTKNTYKLLKIKEKQKKQQKM